MDLGLLQKQVADIIGVTVSSVENWEKQRNSPALTYVPAIVRFLGYDPLPTAESIAEKLMHYRKSNGITQRALAAKIGVDPCTLSRWERAERIPIGAYRERVEALFREFS